MNVNTAGFKKTFVNFADMQVSGGLQTGIDSIRQDFGPGLIESSSSMLDLSLGGDGFLYKKTIPASFLTPVMDA